MWLAVLLAAGVCGAQDAAAAERALRAFRVPSSPSISSWARFKKLADGHGRCTDGVLAGFWDDTVTELFDKQWEAALHFVPLRKDKKFRAFVSTFGGKTADSYAVRRVLKHANHCALQDEKLCSWITENFSR
jgi:hypothetical protein